MKTQKIYAPSWMIIGMSIVLMIVVLVMGIMNHQRERQSLTVLLKEKGAAVMQSFEAGAKTGMMGVLWNESHLQTLLEETARRSDIRYIALVDGQGTILADSDRQQVGTTASAYTLNTFFKPKDTVQWRIRTDARLGRVFEVYKRFLPIDDYGESRHHMEPTNGTVPGREMVCAPTRMRDIPEKSLFNTEKPPTIIIGMDIIPYERAMAGDVRHNYIMGGIIFLVAFAGVLSLFWAQNYWKSRRLLDDTRAFSAEIVRSLPIGMVVVGQADKILYINETACSLLSITPQTAEETVTDKLFPPNLLSLVKDSTGQIIKTHQEITLNTAAHRSALVRVSTSTVFDEEGKTIGYMFILQDITELRALERSSRQREKLAAIGNLAAGIAHEIRNPLSSIKGYVTYFGSLFAEGSENRKAAAVMAGEVDRVNRVISELLEFARPSDLKIKPTNLQTLIDHALRIIAHDLQGANIEISIQLSPDLPLVAMDPDRMTQVLLNVLINAVQAMPYGGNLTITGKQENNGCAIQLTDTGEGISEKDQANIFNPYFTTKKNGTGLGLAIVHKIVEDHGGSIQVRSILGKGTTFAIYLPQHIREEA